MPVAPYSHHHIFAISCGDFALATLLMPPRIRVLAPRLHRLALFVCAFATVLVLFALIPVRLARQRVDTWRDTLVQENLRIGSKYPLKADTMASTSNSLPLNAHLRQGKEALLDRLARPPSPIEAPFAVIMGNEAGDTDSLASAVLLSELLSYGNSREAELFPPGTIFVPLLQQPRKDLALRAENEYLLTTTGLDADDLLFIDDLPEISKLRRTDILLGLTDHPKLSGFWQPPSDFEKQVQIVVDHHADGGAHLDARIRVIKGPENGAVGSAVSVVISLFQGTSALARVSSNLADLALAAILIDTDDLRPVPKGKATDVDLVAAHILLSKSTLSSSQGRANLALTATPDTQAVAMQDIEKQEGTVISMLSKDVRKAASLFHQTLSAKKNDISRLNGHDLLRRDYKENAVQLDGHGDKQIRAGFSSVPVGLSDWIHQRHGDDESRWDAFWKVLRGWMKERKLDVAVVGTSFREVSSDSEKDVRETDQDPNNKRGKHRRELILAYLQPTNDFQLWPSILKHLEEDTYSSSLGNDPAQRLDLEMPWKGTWRVPGTGKKERVGALDTSGRWIGLNEAGHELVVAVWRQRNSRASRKVYMPAVMHAIRMAAAASLKSKA